MPNRTDWDYLHSKARGGDIWLANPGHPGGIGALLPGTPGSLYLPTGTGHAYGYRVVYPAPGKQSGTLICIDGVDDILQATKAQMAFCGWAAAQAVPNYDYLREAPEPAALLAGRHCIPIRLPHAARLVWHKLYSSPQRHGFPEKAAKDQQQALLLAAALAELDSAAWPDAFAAAPVAMTAWIKPLNAVLVRKAGGTKCFWIL